MLKKHKVDTRNQMGLYSIDLLVPEDHYLRDIDKYVDFDFIYDLVAPLYDETDGRPSIDPVMLIKIPLLQYLENIRSMRQTIKQIEVNVAYRWFLGLDLLEDVPHFSTFGKNYTRRFKDTDLFEQIFFGILAQCVDAGLVDSRQVFVDGTHVKAHASRKKFDRKLMAPEALYYTEQLNETIRKEREDAGLKPLKDLGQEEVEPSEKKVSTTDPESGWFHKGEHKEVFAYVGEVACDKHGWVLGFTTHPGNLHDSRTFNDLYQQLKIHYDIEMIIADAGYKTPAIAHQLLSDDIIPVFPYKRPMTKKGYLKKAQYVYNPETDTYTCPQGLELTYRGTNRQGYREYKSFPKHCKTCPLLKICTQSKNHTKVLIRHVWAKDIERCEQIRLTPGVRQIYNRRKETIERIFGTAKEFHGLRYTNENGRAKMHMKFALIFACLNMKKLAKIMKKWDGISFLFWLKIDHFPKNKEKETNQAVFRLGLSTI